MLFTVSSLPQLFVQLLWLLLPVGCSLLSWMCSIVPIRGRDRASFISLMFCNACHRALEIKSARGMEADWSIYLPQYMGLCLWGTLHLFLGDVSVRVPLIGMHGANAWHVRTASMAGDQVTNRTGSASSSATFCRPQHCDLASQPFAVCRSSRALCHSSFWCPEQLIICTHFIILMKKLSNHCYE